MPHPQQANVHTQGPNLININEKYNKTRRTERVEVFGESGSVLVIVQI